MPPTTSRRAPMPRRSLVGVVITALVAGLLALVAPTAATAATGSIVDGGFIISDADFYDYDSMTEKQIQTFLNGKVTTCKSTGSNPTCLKSFTADLPAQPKDAYCSAITAKKGASAAYIIWAVANACKINPEVIIVMLQKEQGLVTSTAPSTRNYTYAMGQNCPDTTGCSTASGGFVNQVYLGAKQFQRYKANPNSYGYVAGKTNTIKWSTNSACGTSQVYIQNQATAGLYIYTPYRPNIAALAAGYGTGDSCSTYGNRNFYNYYYSWFGGSTSSGAPAQVAACTTPAAADIVSASGYVAVTASTLNVRQAPTTTCSTGVTQLSKGAVVTRTGTYAGWTRATVDGKTVWLSNDYLTDAVLTPTPTISGTAVAGQVLTANHGTWYPVPASYGYQWKRDGKNISGATSKTYRVTNDDAGKKITVTVTAKFTGGKASVSKTSSAKSATGYSTTRLAGDNRYQTAVAASKAAYPKGVSTVYLATGTDFADALSVAPLAASQNAALLLSPTAKMRSDVAAELKRLNPSKVVLVGGNLALDSGTANRVRAVLGSSVKVTRIAGENRYETSRLVADQWSTATKVFIATGADFADALGAAAIAGAQNMPVVLVNGTASSVDSATSKLLKGLKTKTAYVVGGEKAVSKGIATALKNAGMSVTRYGGDTRYKTNALLNAAFFTGSVSSAVVATGVDFPDAMTGSVLAATTGAPLFVTGVSCAASGMSDFFLSASVQKATLLGGTLALSSAVAQMRRC